ncbi:MAG: antitoxin PrlF [Candidatus Nanohaloarchaea archaeon]|jgi:antitoxin PrlF
MGVSKITRNFQVTIPEDIRKLKGYKQGDELVFLIDNGEVKLVKKESKIIEETSGIWKDKKVEEKLERSRREEWEERINREKRSD